MHRLRPTAWCINSFTSDPCPKHLECFNGCLHLARTGVISEQDNLERMRDKFAKVIITLEALPEDRRNIGWANQLLRASLRYENIIKALGTEPGMQVFPDGTDLSVTAEDEDVTVRAVCRRSDGIFKHATDITRNEARRRAVEGAIKKQETIRTAVNRSTKKSRAELEKLAAARNAEIEQLQADKELRDRVASCHDPVGRRNGRLCDLEAVLRAISGSHRPAGADG